MPLPFNFRACHMPQDAPSAQTENDKDRENKQQEIERLLTLISQGSTVAPHRRGSAGAAVAVATTSFQATSSASARMDANATAGSMTQVRETSCK